MVTIEPSIDQQYKEMRSKLEEKIRELELETPDTWNKALIQRYKELLQRIDKKWNGV